MTESVRNRGHGHQRPWPRLALRGPRPHFTEGATGAVACDECGRPRRASHQGAGRPGPGEQRGPLWVGTRLSFPQSSAWAADRRAGGRPTPNGGETAQGRGRGATCPCRRGVRPRAERHGYPVAPAPGWARRCQQTQGFFPEHEGRPQGAPPAPHTAAEPRPRHFRRRQPLPVREVPALTGLHLRGVGGPERSTV